MNIRIIKTGILVTAIAVALLLLSGCATKKYVRQQIDPLTGKVTELSEVTRKNSSDIKDVDTRAQQGIQAANDRADSANSKAQSADQKAESAQSMAKEVQGQVDGVATRFNKILGNIDNYKTTDTVKLHFGSNQYKLDDKAKTELESMAMKIKDRNGFIVQVEGYTDSTGNKEYNNDLSQKRAQSVVRYMAEKYDIPLYRMFIIGLGESKPVEPNNSRKGREENRRVEVHLLENPEILSAQK